MTDHAEHDSGPGLSPEAVTRRERMLETLADGRPHPIADFTTAPAHGASEDELDEVFLEVLADDPRFIVVDDDVVDLHALLDGRVVTHPVGAGERDQGVLVIRPDLDLPTLGYLDAVALTDGGTARVAFDADVTTIGRELAAEVEAGVLRLPDGGLGDPADGDLVAVRVRDGALAIEPAVADPSLTEAAGAALATAFERERNPEIECAMAYRVALRWVLDDQDALRTVHEPFTTLFAAAGLERRGDWVGRAGETWQSPPERQAAADRAARSEAYGFDDCCERAYDVVEASFRERTPGVSLRTVAESLAHGQVAAAFLATVLGHAGHHMEGIAENLQAFADELLPHARGTDAASVLHVRAVAYECLGRVAEAERDVAGALRIDPENPHALVVMAGYLEDRGDAVRALDHLRRAGVPDDYPQVTRLARLADLTPARVGRNDPCPCGSGKKYKACCIDAPALPATDHVEWLYARALGFILHPSRQGVSVHLAAHAVERAREDLSPGERLEADVRFAELALFEESGLEWFGAWRESLLPAADAELIADWEDEPLVLMTVDEIGDGRGRVTVDGEDEPTPIRTFSVDEVTAGMRLVGRLLPAHGELWLAGPLVEVPDSELATARELTGDPETEAFTWAEWIGHVDGVEAGTVTEPFVRRPHHHH